MIRIANSILWAVAIALVSKWGDGGQELTLVLLCLATCSILLPEAKPAAPGEKEEGCRCGPGVD